MQTFSKIALAGLVFSAAVFATDSNATSPKTEPAIDKTTATAELTKKLATQLNLKVNDVSTSPIDGFHQVFTDRGLFYVSTAGDMLIQGKVYSLKDKGISDLSEVAFSKMRRAELAKLDEGTVVFKAEKELFEVTVFTDITCGYCRKMHSQMAAYNELGITVRYMAYPRGGLNSKSANDLGVIWCDANPVKAMTTAKTSGKVSGQACATSPVDQHYKLGISFGVNSTPALILPNGALMPGYREPVALLELLKST
ncbi:MAG: thioredoxin fold domain-containing protein [Psychrosphaera sp.]|nr:thioredoxin fold domain-containing protein [Psychrosphaera sp.]